jgi:hypothetical protein
VRGKQVAMLRLSSAALAAAVAALQLAGMQAQDVLYASHRQQRAVFACCASAAALFWAEFATHLATNPEQPFIPTDPTGVAASTAAVTAALAVVGLPCKGAPASPPAAAAAASSAAHTPAQAGAGGLGCSSSYAGSALTLTATSASLLWVKQVKAVASLSAAAAADGAAAAPAGLFSSSSNSASTVLVAERLFDPRFATTTDPETGEQLLLSLQPSEQQPLLAGQAYCHSMVITSTGPSEQQLDILVQVGLTVIYVDVCSWFRSGYHIARGQNSMQIHPGKGGRVQMVADHQSRAR